MTDGDDGTDTPDCLGPYTGLWGRQSNMLEKASRVCHNVDNQRSMTYTVVNDCHAPSDICAQRNRR